MSEFSTECVVASLYVPSKKIYPTSSISCKQLGSRQDHIFKSHNNIDSSTSSYYTMIEVYDGHGSNDCIDTIRSTNTVEIIADCSNKLSPYAPELALEMMLKKKKPFMPYTSGATFSCVRIFNSYVECRSTGDSEIWVFKNGECVYKSPNHVWGNLDEQARIGHCAKPVHSVKPELLSATSIAMVEATCVQWIAPYTAALSTDSFSTAALSTDSFSTGKLPLRLVPTQSLGHRGITGLSPAIQRIDFTDADDIRIIIGSDGFWDMVMPTEDNEFLLSCSTADELCNFAEKRWKQEWDFIENIEFPNVIEKTWFDAYDDISVGFYRKPTV